MNNGGLEVAHSHLPEMRPSNDKQYHNHQALESTPSIPSSESPPSNLKRSIPETRGRKGGLFWPLFVTALVTAIVVGGAVGGGVGSQLKEAREKASQW